MKTTTNPCFSNGTEFMMWQDRNCCHCVKAVWYNEKTNTFPDYRCAVQGQIEGQSAGIMEINVRTFEVAQQPECPHKQTERKKYSKKTKGMEELF